MLPRRILARSFPSAASRACPGSSSSNRRALAMTGGLIASGGEPGLHKLLELRRKREYRRRDSTQQRLLSYHQSGMSGDPRRRLPPETAWSDNINMPLSFEPRLDILPKSQRELWPDLDAVPSDFVLYGGTALALQLGHRISEDFDFFSSTGFDRIGCSLVSRSFGISTQPLARMCGSTTSATTSKATSSVRRAL